MVFNLRCKFCGESHKASSDNFPLALQGDVEAFEGRGRNKKSLGMKRQIIGYACKKCVDGYHRAEFIKEHKIKPGPGQRIKNAIREKLKELAAGVKFNTPIASAETKQG